MIQARAHRAGRSSGFTLIELLVAIGIIAVLGALTVVGFRTVAKDARLAGAENTLASALGNARALAMKNNTLVCVVFRAHWDPNTEKRQFTEIVTAQWTGESYIPAGYTVDDGFLIDRYLPVADLVNRPLPAGVKVAGPIYSWDGSGQLDWDMRWLTQPELRLTDPSLPNMEEAGQMIGVLYGPDGTVRTTNPSSQALENQAFVDFSNGDFDNDGDVQDVGSVQPGNTIWYSYDEPNDENNINFVSLLAIYDDDDAREVRTGDWANAAGFYIEELGGRDGYISRFGRRINFNPSTGVVMTTERDR